jgi:hypothetical protein
MPRLRMSGVLPSFPLYPVMIVKKIYKWKPFTGRPVGRPKSRWEDGIRNDLKKMKIIEWTGQVQDRLKWKGIVEKARTLPEL